MPLLAPLAAAGEPAAPTLAWAVDSSPASLPQVYAPEGALYRRETAGSPWSRPLLADLSCGERSWDLTGYGWIRVVFSAGERLYAVAEEESEVALVELGAQPIPIRRVLSPNPYYEGMAPR